MEEYEDVVKSSGAQLTRYEVRHRWVAAGGTTPTMQPTMQPTTQPTIQPTTQPSTLPYHAGVMPAPTPSPTFLTSYLEYVYMDSKCATNAVFISAQLLGTCYRQSSLYQNQPYYMRSVVSTGVMSTSANAANATASYTEIDSYYSDSGCTVLLRNLTLVHPTTSPLCSPLRSSSNPSVLVSGYWIKGMLVTAFSFPSSGLAIVDYPTANCNYIGGMPLEGYFFASSQCVFNRYMASCTGTNGGPLISVFDPSQGACQGRAIGSFSLSLSCTSSLLGHASYEVTSGCPAPSFASFVLIELFVGMVVFVFLCGCASCAGMRVAIGWRRHHAMVAVVDGPGDPFDQYISRPRGMPHMTVHYAVPAEATFAQEEGHCDPDTVVAVATPMGVRDVGVGSHTQGEAGDRPLCDEDVHVATPVLVRRLSLPDDGIPVAHAQPARTIADLSPRSVRYLQD